MLPFSTRPLQRVFYVPRDDCMLNVFAYEAQFNSVCLAPRRSGDLRDCALELVNLMQGVARLRSESL